MSVRGLPDKSKPQIVLANVVADFSPFFFECSSGLQSVLSLSKNGLKSDTTIHQASLRELGLPDRLPH